jgi:hypothetical protein
VRGRPTLWMSAERAARLSRSPPRAVLGTLTACAQSAQRTTRRGGMCPGSSGMPETPLTAVRTGQPTMRTFAVASRTVWSHMRPAV